MKNSLYRLLIGLLKFTISVIFATGMLTIYRITDDSMFNSGLVYGCSLVLAFVWSDIVVPNNK